METMLTSDAEHRGSAPGRIAVVLMVKDEADELLPWISWYVSLGVTTIFVFDDGSADDTLEVARLAALSVDVRTIAIPQDGLPHPERQRDCYISVLREHGRDFDWIGFFDADEYLDLPPGVDLGSFLLRGSDVGAIGISWCNYGSSDNVLKPNDHPFNAYVHHFPAYEDIGRHIKTFVRPSAWTGRWFNVHYFELADKRYVDPAGRDIVWAGTPGVTLDKATWQGGRLMHYQCRSMEHFIERMRKRPDLPKSTRIWDSYNNNAVHAELLPQRRLQVTTALYAILLQAVRSALADLAVSTLTTAPADQPGPIVSAAKPLFRFWQVLSDDGFVLRVRADTATVTADLPPVRDDHDDECLLLTIDGRPDMAFLFAAGLSAPLQMKGEIRVPSLLRFAMAQEGERVTLRNPTSHRFLTAVPKRHGGTLVCDRFAPSDWEMFRLLPLGDQHAAAASQRLRLALLPTALVDPAVLLQDDGPGLDLVPLLLAFASAMGDRLRTTLGTAARYLD